MSRLKIAIVGSVHPRGLNFLRENEFEVFEINDFDPENLKEKLEFADGVLLRTPKLDKNILSNCKNIKIISRHGVGYDNVDLNYINNKKISLCITSTSNAVSVAEHVLSFFIYLTKNLTNSDILVRSGNFKKKSELPNFFELYEKKVLIFGFGRIGMKVARRCQGFEMDVYVYDPFVDDDIIKKHNCVPIEKNEGLSLADFVTIHLPLNKNTKNFISETELKSMKSNSIIVNTSRGGIINESDLYQALSSKIIKAAGMDVFETEPPSIEHPFFNLDNILLTPHNAALTLECRERMSLEASQNIVYFFKDKNKLKQDNLINKNFL